MLLIWSNLDTLKNDSRYILKQSVNSIEEPHEGRRVKEILAQVQMFREEETDIQQMNPSKEERREEEQMEEELVQVTNKQEHPTEHRQEQR